MATKGASMLCLVPLLLATGVEAETLVGLREADQHLIIFDSSNPAVITGDLALTGFPTGVQPMGIDYSAITGKLYLVGRGPTTNECQLYSMNPGSTTVVPVGTNRFRCGGIVEDIDVNPLNGNVRFMGGNEVLDVNIDGAVIQLPDETARRRANSAYPETGDASSGRPPDIRAVAYTNNVKPAPVSTSLFAIDTAQHTLVGVGPDKSLLDPPTTLTTIGSGLGAGGGALDISSDTGTAYMFDYDYGAEVTLHGNLYKVDLSTGVATLVGKVGTTSLNLLGMTALPAVTTNPKGGGTLSLGLLLAGLGGAFLRRGSILRL